MLRTSLILAGLLVAASPANAQSDRPTSNRAAAELYVQLCQMCHMPDGNAAITRPLEAIQGEVKVTPTLAGRLAYSDVVNLGFGLRE